MLYMTPISPSVKEIYQDVDNTAFCLSSHLTSLPSNTTMTTQTEVQTSEPLEKYIHPPETKHKSEYNKWHKEDKKTEANTVKYADLVTIDLSEFDRIGGKQKLAEHLKKPVHELGITVHFLTTYKESY